MKTKHFLTALALPAMFAACTAEDIVSENNGLQQDQRAKLSKDFVLSTIGEVESRYVVEGSTALEFKFEEGDLIGANLIDAYTKADDAEKFDKNDPATWQIVDYIAPALPFENIGENQWKSAGELGIGNYLFTNPYNPEDKDRSAAKYELPIVIQYSSENPNAHIEAYNKAVAATILRKGDTEANISLKNLYTYPKVRINFPKDDEVSKVTKVILKREGGFIYKGVINNKAVAKMFNPDFIAKEMKDNKWTVEDYWANQQTEDFVVADAGVNDEILTTPTLVYEMNEKVTANNLEVRLMLPSIESLLELQTETSDKNEVITMFICTDKGNYQFELTDLGNYTFKSSTLAAVKDKALWRSKSNTLTVNSKKLSDATDTDIDELLKANIVSTAADWNALVEKYGDLVKYSDAYKKEMAKKVEDGEIEATESDAANLVVTIVGDEFALTSDLKMPEIAEFVIQSDVNVEGEVTLKNIEVSMATGATEAPVVTLKEGAKLTTDQTLEAAKVVVEEGAEMVFTAAYNEKDELIAYTGIEVVDNEGIVTVPTGVEATFTLNNLKKDAKLNVGEAATRSAAVAKLNLKGGENDGLIENNGEVNVVEAAFVNNDSSEEAGYTQDEETEKWDGRPTVNNNGVWNSKNTTTNNGLFVNKGTVTSNFTSTSDFTNAGTLEVGENAKTFIDDNTSGEIILAKLEPTDFTIFDAKNSANYTSAVRGDIKYTINSGKDAEDVDLSTSPVNYLIVNGSVNFNKSYINTKDDADATNDAPVALPTLEMIGDGVIAVVAKTADANVAQITNLLISAGDVEVSGTMNSVANIKVMPNATLTVPVSASLEVAKEENLTYETAEEDEEDALIQVNGKLNFTGEEGDTDGVFTVTKTNLISLGKEAVVTAVASEGDYVANKLDAVVEDFWGNIEDNFSAHYDKENTVGKIWGDNPYDVENFVNFLMGDYSSADAALQGKIEALLNGTVANGGWALTEETREEVKAKLIANYDTFVAAVDRYVFKGIEAYTSTALTTYKETYIDAKTGAIKSTYAPEESNRYLFNSEAAAMRDLLGRMVKVTKTPATIEEYKENLKIYKNIKTTAVSTALNATEVGTGEYTYIWKDCTLAKAVKVWADYKGLNNYTSEIAGVEAPSKFVGWCKTIFGNATANASIITELNAAGVTAKNFTDFVNYHVHQYQTVAGASWVELPAETE